MERVRDARLEVGHRVEAGYNHVRHLESRAADRVAEEEDFRNAHPQRFLDEDVLPGADRGQRVQDVPRVERGNAHRVDVVAGHEFAEGGPTILDTLARVLSFRGEIPVGVVTALLGGPVFCVLLARRSAGRAERRPL